MSKTVKVEGISSQTTEKEVRDFFSFCGKISDLSVESSSGDTKSATVTFEKETAAKTALLLDNTQLGPGQVSVKSASSSSEKSSEPKTEEHEGDDVTQEDKPRSRIVAEYLAHGYVISDKIIERALALDQQHGVSSRFTQALSNFDNKYKATEKGKAVDDRYAVTKSAASAWNSLSSYFDQGLNSSTGQKLRQFYEQGSKQVLDVHNEARHLANLKSGKSEKSESSSQAPTQTASAAEGSVPGTSSAPLES